jgi:hypothetical protein
MGVMLGDGCLINNNFSTADEEIVEYIKENLHEGYDVNRRNKYDYAITSTKTKAEIQSLNSRQIPWNHYVEIFKDLDLRGKRSHEKFIPEIYKNGSVSQRIQLIQGLMDTDGEVDKKTGSLSYTTVSEQLCDDFVEIVRSIGGIAKVRTRIPTYTYNGEKRQGKLAYTVRIRYPEPRKLVSLSRKVNRTPENYQYKDLKLRIETIAKVTPAEAQCIMIDHVDHLYITDEYVVTHNTYLCKKLAEHTGAKLLRYDMSEYQEKHTVSKLIGAPPGYVGHGEGKNGEGQLIQEVEANPNCILLLDEVEKAASEVTTILLQVMDDGRLTSSKGKTVDFTNVTLILTSNLGAADSERKRIGFGDQANTMAYDEALKKHFTPEFRNRLDAVVQFNKLEDREIKMIVNAELSDLQNTILEQHITMSYTPKARTMLAREGFDELMGARPLKRLIQDKIKKPLSKEILFSDLGQHGGIVKVDYVNDDFVLQVAKINPPPAEPTVANAEA